MTNPAYEATNSVEKSCKYCGGSGRFRWQQSADLMPCPCVGCTELAVSEEPSEMDKEIEVLREAVRRAPLTKPEGLSPEWQAYFDAVTPLHVAGLIASLERAQQELIKPLAIGELIHRLENQTGEKWILEVDHNGMMQLSNELAEMKRKCAEFELDAKRYSLVRDGDLGEVYMWDMRGQKYEECGEYINGTALDEYIDSMIHSAGGTIEGSE